MFSIRTSGVLAIAMFVQLLGSASVLATPVTSQRSFVWASTSAKQAMLGAGFNQFTPSCPSGNCGPDSSGGTGTR